MDKFDWVQHVTAMSVLAAVLYGLYRLAYGALLGEKNGLVESYRRYVASNERAATANEQLGRHIQEYDRKQTESCNSHALLLGGVAETIEEHLEVARESHEIIKTSNEQILELTKRYGDDTHIKECTATFAKIDAIHDAMVKSCEKLKDYSTVYIPEQSDDISDYCDSILKILQTTK